MKNFCQISFDFDDTLCLEVKSGGWYGGLSKKPITKYIELLKEYHALGCKCIILTARTPTEADISEVNQFLKLHDLKQCVSEIHYTSHELKGPFAKKLKVDLHYDDSDKHLKSLAENQIRTIKATLDEFFGDLNA
jgi:acid phosphatase class B